MLKPAIISPSYINLYHCPVCRGHGERADEKSRELRTCVACGGTGWIRRKKEEVWGMSEQRAEEIMRGVVGHIGTELGMGFDNIRDIHWLMEGIVKAGEDGFEYRECRTIKERYRWELWLSIIEEHVACTRVMYDHSQSAAMVFEIQNYYKRKEMELKSRIV